MNSKTTSFAIKENIIREFDNSSKEYPTIDDLMREQNVVIKKANSVHRRRDLDSLG